MSYSHRIAQYFHAAHTPTLQEATGLLSVCITTKYDRWEFVTNSAGWAGVSNVFMIEYIKTDSGDPTLIGTPLIHTWSADEEEGIAYRYRIIKNQLFGVLDENEYRQLIGTLVALDSFYRNPQRDITAICWDLNTNDDTYELPMVETQILAVPYLGSDVVDEIDILVPERPAE